MSVFSRLLEAGQVDDVTVVRLLPSEIHRSELDRMRSELVALVEKRGRVKLLLDFTNVEYLFSDVLEMLLYLHRITKEAQGRLGVCCVSPVCLAVIKATRLDEVFNIAADEAAALREFKDADSPAS